MERKSQRVEGKPPIKFSPERPQRKKPKILQMCNTSNRPNDLTKNRMRVYRSSLSEEKKEKIKERDREYQRQKRKFVKELSIVESKTRRNAWKNQKSQRRTRKSSSQKSSSIKMRLLLLPN